MINTSLRTNWIAAGFLIFLVSLLSYVYYTYHTAREEIMQQIDTRLLNAAVSVKHILGNDYHTPLNSGKTIPHFLYQQKSRQLSEFANSLDIAYVYAMVLKGNHVHFTASSYTQEDQNSGKVTQLFDLYPEATKANISAFYSTEPVFEISKDQWGHFKSIFVPYIDSKGNTYLTGADIRMYDLNEHLNKSVSKAAALASFFFFIALLVASIYIYLLKRALSTDSSSGFANHIALEYYMSKSPNLHLQMAVIWVNEIEDINSFYGTKVGDKVMKSLLEYFAKRRPTGSDVFRLATNKIVLIAPFNEQHTGFSDLIQGYNFSSPLLKEPFIYITLCTGVAHGNKAMLLENAHIAALQAKQGRFSVINYSNALHDVKNQYQYNVEMAKEVREAFDNNRVVAYFQPVYDYSCGIIIQYECLARMITSHGEILLPDSFLDVVNRSRMDGTLTRTMLTQCFERFRRTSLCWSINITAHDMLDPSLTEYLEQELNRYPQPSNITLELLETEAIANFSEVKAFIALVKQRGVKVIIDDFGTGYSNISNVLKLDVDGIKLDGSLITQIIHDTDIYLYIEHIASFAKQLNLKLIAECVENKPTINTLLKANVHLMQGNYFAPPAPQINPHIQTFNLTQSLNGDSVDHSPNIFAQME